MIGIGIMLSSDGFASGAGDGGFEWDPEGVVAGVDFQSNREFNGSVVGSNLASLFTGTFNAASISSNGMAVFDEDDSNRPEAAGWLFDKLASLDYTCVIYWHQQTFFPSNKLLQFVNVDSSDGMDVSLSSNGAASEASGWNGEYNSLGSAYEFSDNVLAFSTNADGVLASLNGAAAVLSTPMVSFISDVIRVGCDKDNGAPIEGWLKAIIFYPKTNVAAELEDYAAHAVPENTSPVQIPGPHAVGVEIVPVPGIYNGVVDSFEYRWYRNTFAQSGFLATAPTYTPIAEDAGQFIYCVEVAINTFGRGGSGVIGDNPVS